MTTDGSAAAVAGRILADLDRLVVRLGQQYREVPEYAALSETAMRTEVLTVSRGVASAFLSAIIEGRDPSVSELEELQTMGRRRLEMGVPLEPMLHVYRIFGRVVWDAVVAATKPGEERVLAELGARWMDFVDQASSVAAASYLDASHERIRRVDARRGALLQALLAAEDSSEVAAVATEFTTTFAAAYIPVLVAAEDGASRIDAVSRACPPGTIAGLRGGHLLLLVPDGMPDLRAVRAAVGGGLAVHGEVVAPGAALQAELAHTEAILQAALVKGRVGTFGPDDLLVDQLVHGNRRVADALRRRVLDQLTENDRAGLVVSTVRMYLATGSVPTTAHRLSVHPNTVAYRLKRVADVTGFDPRVPADAAVLVLALASADL